jgi:hypothetical protein
LLPDGNVLIVGGSDHRDWSGRYNSAEIYHAATGTFTSTDNMSAARFKLAEAIALLNDESVLIAGGGERLEIYDPMKRTFAVANGQMDAARFFSTATTLQDGRVLILGGYDTNIMPSAIAWIFTP